MAEKKAGRKITQVDIARELGISTATVSLALRNSSKIGEQRCREVQEVADRLGYRPNSAAAQLAHHRHSSTVLPLTSAVAWINAWQSPEDLRAVPQFDGYWQGASAAAGRLGYRLEEFRINAAMSPARLHQILSARGIRGVMLPPQRDQPDWQGFPWSRYSVVKFGHSLQEPACNIVAAAQVANAMLSFERIRARGYRRVGYLTNIDQAHATGGNLFEAGVLMAQRHLDATQQVPSCIVTGLPRSGRAERVAAWVAKHQVDAILTDLSEAADILRRAGLRVPQDVGLALTNVAHLAGAAGIDQLPLEIGRVGVLALHSLLTHRERGAEKMTRQILVNGLWQDGDLLPTRV